MRIMVRQGRQILRKLIAREIKDHKCGEVIDEMMDDKRVELREKLVSISVMTREENNDKIGDEM